MKTADVTERSRLELQIDMGSAKNKSQVFGGQVKFVIYSVVKH